MRLINVKENGAVEHGFRSPRLEINWDYMVFYDFLPELHQPHAHTYQNIKDLVDIFSSDLDAVNLEYFVSLR